MTSIVKFPVDQVKDEWLNASGNRSKWDAMIKSAETLKQVGEVRIFRMETPPIAIVSPREVVAWSVVRTDGAGGFISAIKSLKNSEKEVPLKKDVVRAEIIISGAKLEAITVDGKPATRITNIGCNDPKGSVPKLNLNSIYMKGSTSIKALCDYLEKQTAK
eukprot:Phypoly_transcript_08424.p1 GENE.Phypoly_transcript_08424~~Phypoly_transcript_08424.p1  ORF type:complete len:161 (-),score=19.96 Phypoly_transcript_08424:643-1125(-)